MKTLIALAVLWMITILLVSWVIARVRMKRFKREFDLTAYNLWESNRRNRK